MYGLGGIFLGILFNSVIVYAIGLGLFVDELTYVFMKGETHEDNYSKVSLLGTVFFVIVVFFLQDYLLMAFNL